MEGKTAWTGFILSIMIGQVSKQVQGCVETFPSIDNSNTHCSNLTTTCSVTCTRDRMFYDGNNTNNYSCNSDNVWTPYIPKYGCLEKYSKVYRIQLEVEYFSSHIATYCLDAHQQAMSENQVNISENVFRLCNSYEHVVVGNIVVNNFTSSSSSFDIYTTIEFVITDSSTTYTSVNACVSILKDELQNGGLELHKDTLECNDDKISNISLPLQNITSEVRVCNNSDVMVNSENGTFCVPSLPVVGIKQRQYRVNISEDVVLYSDILFGSFINSVEWMHANKTITTSDSKKYNGSTQDLPSLTIYDVTGDDAGEYICRVRNVYGTQNSHVIMLVVLSTSDDEMSTEQATTAMGSSVDSKTVSTAGSSTTISTTRRYEEENESEKDKILYIAIGAGCGGLIIIIVITIVAIKRKVRNTKDKRNPHRNDGHHEPEYDGLKDNILYVQSDDGLKDNILYVPSEQHDITDGDYSSVDLERSGVKRVSVDGNYSTVDLESPDNNLGTSYLKEGAKNTNKDTHFVNKAFEINDENIKHIVAPDGTNNVYAVVDKKKNSPKNSNDTNPEITYAVVDKTKKH